MLGSADASQTYLYLLFFLARSHLFLRVFYFSLLLAWKHSPDKDQMFSVSSRLGYWVVSCLKLNVNTVWELYLAQKSAVHFSKGSSLCSNLSLADSQRASRVSSFPEEQRFKHSPRGRPQFDLWDIFWSVQTSKPKMRCGRTRSPEFLTTVSQLLRGTPFREDQVNPESVCLHEAVKNNFLWGTAFFYASGSKSLFIPMTSSIPNTILVS